MRILFVVPVVDALRAAAVLAVAPAVAPLAAAEVATVRVTLGRSAATREGELGTTTTVFPPGPDKIRLERVKCIFKLDYNRL